eukprot:gi/632977849/ref/XP_007905576.1/ PREDICTED: C-type mannose receptor 2-like [Callorhinchus milii]
MRSPVGPTAGPQLLCCDAKFGAVSSFYSEIMGCGERGPQSRSIEGIRITSRVVNNNHLTSFPQIRKREAVTAMGGDSCFWPEILTSIPGSRPPVSEATFSVAGAEPEGGSDPSVFMIYSDVAQSCLESSGNAVGLSPVCNQSSEQQQWKWVSRLRLFNLGSRQCLAMLRQNGSGASAALGTIECDLESAQTRWHCGKLGEQLGGFLNRSPGGAPTSGSWDPATAGNDVWRIYKTNQDLCARPYHEIYTIQGNSNGKPCTIPFKYDNQWYHGCTTIGREDGHLWCATTVDYGRDERWGFCPIMRLLTGYSATLWIGLNDLDIDGGWQWSDGSPLKYLNWEEDQPVNSLEENCGVIRTESSGRWQNKDCGIARPYVCKKKPNGTAFPDTYTWKNFKTTCESGWLPFHCNCYRLNSEKRTWQEARKSCVRSEGDLLSVHHLAELEFVLTSVKQDVEELWIGLNDIKLQMNFAWSDGSPVNFTYWHPYEPNNFHSSQEDCVTLWGEGGRWNDGPCNLTLPSICKKASCLGEEEVEDDLGCQKVSEKHHRGIQWEEGFNGGCVVLATGNSVGLWEVKDCNSFKAKYICRQNLATPVTPDPGPPLPTPSLTGSCPQGWLSSPQLRYCYKCIPHPHSAVSNSAPSPTSLTVLSPVGSRWSDSSILNFVSWAFGKPRPITKDRKCVYMLAGKEEWGDQKCLTDLQYVCKRTNVSSVVPPLPPPPSVSGGCPGGWTPFLNKCFQLQGQREAERVSWIEGKAACERAGGVLATISNRLEQASLTDRCVCNTLPQGGSRFSWMGDRPVPYTHWQAGEPQQSTGCVYMEVDGTWRTSNCDVKRQGAICKVNGEAVSVKSQFNGTCPTRLHDSNWIAFRNHCYTFNLEKKAASKDAGKICRKEHGAEVLSILDETENVFIWEHLQTYEKEARGAWLGLSYNPKGDSLVWSDKIAVNYSNWVHQLDIMRLTSPKTCYWINSNTGGWVLGSCTNVTLGIVCKRPRVLESDSPVSTELQSHTLDIILYVLGAALLLAVLLVLLFLYRRTGGHGARGGAFESARYSRTTSAPSESLEKNILVSDMEMNEQQE